MNIGICFGGYCPMHQGHLDIIMRAKKENDIAYIVVCGYDNESRANQIGLPLRRRVSLVKKMFKDDEQIKVFEINDTTLGLDESCSIENWVTWIKYLYKQIPSSQIVNSNNFTWYVGEEEYVKSIRTASTILHDKYKYMDDYLICSNIFSPNIEQMDREINPISATKIRENPIKYWDKIAWPFRSYFSTNILITGTASEGKSTLTRDIANYFGIPYSEEYGRTYMEKQGKTDIDLTINDFLEFLIEQRRDTKKKIESAANNGIIISDTDNLVTLMYAKAYVEDTNIDLSEADYECLENTAKNLQRGITWDKIFLLLPGNVFVDDGCRYMKQASLDERIKNKSILLDLIEKFGWKDKVVFLKGGEYKKNFETIRDYINEKYK